MVATSHLTKEVFVPGSYPALTLNKRESTNITGELLDYVERGDGDCLLVHGPSQGGKTVLVESILPQARAIWVRGDELNSVDDLFGRISDELGLFTEESEVRSTTDTVGGGVGVDLGVPGLRFRATANAQGAYKIEGGKTRTSMPLSVVKASIRDKPVPIVIDDFHFLKRELRAPISMAVKDLVRSTRVVLVSVPPNAFDEFRSLPDVDRRIQELVVKRWSTEELSEIARTGFALLNIVDHEDRITSRLARESRGAPSIMQRLCLEYVHGVLDIGSTQDMEVTAREPHDWSAFLHKIARRRKPKIFDRLLEGKDTRGQDRVVRELKDGGLTDIYGAVFMALREIGVVGSLTSKEIASAMGEFVVDPPTASALAGTLKNLADIAESKRGDRDPVLTFSDKKLHVVDPDLSFYLVHGGWEPPAPKRAVR